MEKETDLLQKHTLSRSKDTLNALFFSKKELYQRLKNIDFEALLSKEEMKRYKEIAHQERQNEFKFGRVLLYLTLSRLLNLDTGKIKITTKEKGKPELEKPLSAHVFFSLSHSKEHMLLCLSTSKPLGCDVESFNRFEDMSSKLLKAWLHPDEQKTKPTAKELCSVWTKKEAFSKAKETGLSEGFSKLDTNKSAAFKGGHFFSLPFDKGIISLYSVGEGQKTLHLYTDTNLKRFDAPKDMIKSERLKLFDLS